MRVKEENEKAGLKLNIKKTEIMTNSGKLLERWEYQTILSVSWETCIQVKKQQLEPYIEQLTGSKLGQEYVKSLYCYHAYLNCMQCISYKMPGWINQLFHIKF